MEISLQATLVKNTLLNYLIPASQSPLGGCTPELEPQAAASRLQLTSKTHSSALISGDHNMSNLHFCTQVCETPLCRPLREDTRANSCSKGDKQPIGYHFSLPLEDLWVLIKSLSLFYSTSLPHLGFARCFCSFILRD